MKYTYNSAKMYLQAKSLMENINKESVDKVHNEFRLIKKSNDGNAYAIVKENSKYALKKAKISEGLTYDDFQYVTGAIKRHKSLFESFNTAVKGLTSILKNTDTLIYEGTLYKTDVKINATKQINENEASVEGVEVIEDDDDIVSEMMTDDNEIDSILNDESTNKLLESLDNAIAEGEKFTMKIPNENNEEDFGGDELPIGDDSSDEDIPMDDDFGDEDIPMDDAVSDDSDSDNNDGENSDEKEIQRLAGSLATAIRDYNKNNGVDSEVTKYAVNSVLSAIDVSDMSEEDIDDMRDKLEEVPEEDGDDFGGEDVSDLPSDNEDEFDLQSDNEDEQIDEDLTNASWDEKSAHVVNSIDRMKRDDFNKTPRPFTGDATKFPSRDEVKARYKNTDPSRPLGDGNLSENFNKNIEEYLVKQINPRIFAKEDNKDMVNNAPTVAPTETKPTVKPDRKQKPFQKPSVKPQPKFRA